MQFFDIDPLPDYDPQIAVLVAALKDSTREWRDELGDPPVEAIVWQAEPESYSIGGLLLHIIDVEDFWLRNFAAGLDRDPTELKTFLSEETRQDEGIWPIPPSKPLGWYYELHDCIRTRALESIQGIEPTRRYERPARDFTTTFRWVAAHVLQHDSYHGGQAVALHELWKRRRA